MTPPDPQSAPAPEPRQNGGPVTPTRLYLPPALRTEKMMPSGMASATTAWALLRAFRRRWLIAVSLGILLAGAAATVAWFVVPPPKDMARSLLLVQSSQPVVLFKPAEPQ